MNKLNENVYIPSLHANDIYGNMVRGTYINNNFKGMIPYSLELIKLKEEGLISFTSKRQPKKVISTDVINVKFSQKVKSGKELIKLYEAKKENTKDEEYKGKLNKYIKSIEMELDSNNPDLLNKWDGMSADKLREKLYKEGFTLTRVDKDKNVIKTEYVLYKRSSSKSRKGECLFIKKSLYNEMIDWSRMYLPFVDNQEINLASLRAYESLVGSALVDVIKIDPHKILLIDDVESKFNYEVNKVQSVKVDKKDVLKSIPDTVQIANSLWDGESLLSSDYFKENQSMLLLRNHWFKSAAFSTNIQLFLKDKHKELNIQIPYEQWELTDMFGDKILAKDCEMITTPSSLKCLKISEVFKDVKNPKQHMFGYWKALIESEGNLFGVCKSEKKSKRGTNEEGRTVNQTSYQMLNSLPIDQEIMGKLSEFEKRCIDRLKNDDEYFKQYLLDSATTINSNEMFAKLYEVNSEITHTKIFKDMRKRVIRDHIKYLKKGKVKIVSDYLVLFGMPYEYLLASIGQLDLAKPNLKGNEVYTTQFDFNKEITLFRNPHTSQSNVVIGKNVDNDYIKKYFNLTDNIICINVVNTPILTKLSGADFDSDSVLATDSKDILELGKKCQNYKVCHNAINDKPADHKLNSEDMAKIDNVLSRSVFNIGETVNVAQLCMSLYWDGLKNNEEQTILNDLLDKISILTVLSEVAIDLSKKNIDINIGKELSKISKDIKLKVENNEVKKPLFWVHVENEKLNKNSTKKSIVERVSKYDCPMDYLQIELDSLPDAKTRKTIKFETVLDNSYKLSDGNRKQIDKVSDLVVEMKNEIVNVNGSPGDKDEQKREIEDIINDYSGKISKLKVKPETMYALLMKIESKDVTKQSKVGTRLMKVMYETQREVFLNSFKCKKVTPVKSNA